MWSLLLATAGWIAGWLTFGAPQRLRARSIDLRDPSPSPTTSDAPEPVLSVVIPARNEEHSLPLLLADLAEHAPPGTEVIVVDDDSVDRTAEVAAGFDGVRVLQAGEKPAGWVGKPWACHTGEQAARADILCFVDADVRIRPNSLEAVLDQHRQRGGLLSIQPFHETEQFYEQGSALFGAVALMGTGTGDRSARPLAFGPLMVSSRADYDRVGGHAAVRSEVVEDIALARRFGDEGLPVAVLTGGDLVAFRMYPEGPRSMFEGWTKSFATGAANTSLWRLGLIVLWLAAMGTAFGLGWDALVSGESVLAGAVIYAAYALQLRVMFVQVGRFGLVTALAFPLLLGCFFVVFFSSLWYTVVRREVRWRGRSVPIVATGSAHGN